MKLHVLKIKKEYFDAILNGDKRFELRKNDRDYHVFDLIHFVDTKGNEFECKAGNLFLITYVLVDCPQYGLVNGYAVLSIRREMFI